MPQSLFFRLQSDIYFDFYYTNNYKINTYNVIITFMFILQYLKFIKNI